jgi:dTDP-4-amino-4,6-dideoxygalactose transaminase
MLIQLTNSPRVVLTSSGTDALEMAAILSEIGPGDEVIMPSFTFVSSANSIVLRGAVPVFCDIDPLTLNLDPSKLKSCLSGKTKAIMPVHYAGVSCEMESILSFARAHNLKVIEDAAHGMGAFYKGQHLGTIGDFGALSFHETKNISCGEGGALLVNGSENFDRSEIVRDKGTNRKQFLRGSVDRYTWVDVGSSFLPSELQSALLLSQLEIIQDINSKRLEIWNMYHEAFSELENQGHIQRPYIGAGVEHNAHIYWIIVKHSSGREALRKYLAGFGIQSTSHYETLHLAPVAAKFGRPSPDGLNVTEASAKNILRLPLFRDLSIEDTRFVIEKVLQYFS